MKNGSCSSRVRVRPIGDDDDDDDDDDDNEFGRNMVCYSYDVNIWQCFIRLLAMLVFIPSLGRREDAFKGSFCDAIYFRSLAVLFL